MLILHNRIGPIVQPEERKQTNTNTREKLSLNSAEAGGKNYFN